MSIHSIPANSAVDRPLRILHLTMASDAGGLSRYIFDLAFAMHRQGHQVSVGGGRGAWHWLFETAPFPWIDIPFRGGIFSLGKSSRVLEDYLDKNQIDVLHTHYRRCTLIARRVQAKYHNPILYTLHLSNIPMDWIRRRFSDFGDHTHVAADEARQWLVQAANVPHEQISLIPHGVDPKSFPVPSDETRAAARASFGIAADETVAAYVGRMDAPKNEQWMLDLASASRSRLPKLKVMLVGEGPHEKMLRKRIQKENLKDRVVLLGHRDPKPIYHAADALLLPSTREGFSLVCAEAMSTGIPVLRTQTSGTKELIVENTTGKSVPIDHDIFVNTALDFLADRTNLHRMGTLAAQHIQDHFSFDRQLRDTIDLYRSMVKMHQPH